MTTTLRRLRAPLALGLTLALSPLSHAAGLAAQRGQDHLAKVAAHKTAIAAKIANETLIRKRHAELEAIIASPTTSDERIYDLLEHHKAFPDGAHSPAVIEHGGVSFAVGDKRLVVVEDGAQRRAEPADLVRAGITDKASFVVAITQRFHDVSGVPADITDRGNAALRAQRELRQTTAHATSVLSHFAYHGDVNLATNHHREVTTARTSAGFDSQLHFGGTPGSDQLTLGIFGVGRTKDGKSKRISYQDLAAHGITSVEHADAHIARELVRIAGIPGDPTRLDVIEAARAKLVQERAEVAELKKIVEAASEHYGSDIDFVREAHAMMAPLASGQPREIILAQKAGVTLQVRTVAAPASQPAVRGRVAPPTPKAQHKIVVVDDKTPNGRGATIEDLHGFGIDHKADLDAAMGDAVLRIAEEDFPH